MSSRAFKRGHRPIRTCLGCGARDEHQTMLRFAVGPSGMLTVCQNGVGRGGYVHERKECFDAFVKRKSVYRAFRAEISKSARESLISDLRPRAHGE